MLFLLIYLVKVSFSVQIEIWKAFPPLIEFIWAEVSSRVQQWSSELESV